MTSVPSFFAEYQRDVDADVRSERQAGAAPVLPVPRRAHRTAVAHAQHEGDRALWVITQPGRLRRGTGILAFRGSGAATVRTAATALDVAPTILHALGVPVARDLDGRVIEALFAPGSLANYPIRGVDTYGLKATVSRPRSWQPLDEEALERLRSLGYVR
jgi:hypothetical protein